MTGSFTSPNARSYSFGDIFQCSNYRSRQHVEFGNRGRYDMTSAIRPDLFDADFSRIARYNVNICQGRYRTWQASSSWS